MKRCFCLIAAMLAAAADKAKAALAKGVTPELIADKRYVRRGCVLEDHESFDAGFFDMSPREAEITNPQHRVFLQAAWEALEHAGYVPESYDGSIGLFAGAGHNNHAHIHPDLTGVEYLQCLVGNEHDYLTTRTAFKLGLTGPALNIQTACSTSLVAIHAACQALMSGQCDMAVAGGISISWPEGRGYLYGEGLIFSEDGKCRVFDARASGTVFAIYKVDGGTTWLVESRNGSTVTRNTSSTTAGGSARKRPSSTLPLRKMLRQRA